MKKPVQEEKGERAPLWIISFADMISLLMAFFVMLMTMTTEQSGKLCNTGKGMETFEMTLFGFRRTIAGFGFPGLFGSANEGLYFGNRKPNYAVGTPDDTNEVTRVIDAGGERIRRIFSGLESKAKTLKAQIEGQRAEFFPAPVNFTPGDAALDESAQRFLTNFAADLKQAAVEKKTTLYVVGLATQDRGEKEQWILSAKRAEAVAEFLKSTLPAELHLPVYSWGAGPGGQWIGHDGPISKSDYSGQILIAVLKGE
jgi:outer membrane protein OmpA-like peptidoglycan-associated protein